MSSNRMSMRASTGESGVRVLPEMFKHRVLHLAEETVDSLQKIWKEAGYEEVECQRLLGDLLTKLKGACASELAAEQQILDHAKKEVEDNIEELSNLSSQLGRSCNVDHLSKMNCTDKLSELEKLINDITAEVSQRQKLLNTELTSIKDLVDVLGESFPTMDTFSGPEGTPELSDVRLQLMRDYKGELESIKTRRTEEVRGIAKECKPHVVDLVLLTEGFASMPEDTLYSDLDKKIAKFIQTNEFTFGIAKKDIVQISKRLKSFIEEKERRRDELTKTGAEIARLWSLLRVPSAERELFQSSFKMNLSMETVTKGVNELKRLREIRAKSIGKVVGSIRSDILLLWEEVGVITDENRAREFPLYFAPTDDMEDSAVDEHEAYFNTLRVKVEELKPILQKVARRETVVQERIELEHLQMNPERLTARGPNAREERKREEGMSTRVRNLDKNTKELIATIQAWEETNGPFMYGGERYFDRITKQDESYTETRDSLRNARKKKDGKLDHAPPAAPVKTVSSATMKKGTVSTPGKAKITAAAAAQELTLSDVNIALLNQKLNAAYGGGNTGSTVDVKSNAENVAPGGRDSNGSNQSDDTSYTSATEVKERPSTATVVKNHFI